MVMDKEHNPGQFILDFGDIDGDFDVFREVVVRNNTDSAVVFNEPFLLPEEIIFDGGDQPLMPHEKRALRFTLDHRLAEGTRYSMIYLNVERAKGFSFGIQYSASNKQIKYSVSSDSLKIGKSRKALGGEFVFTITNLSDVKFRISEVSTEESFPSVRFDKSILAQNESARIAISFSDQDLPALQKQHLNVVIHVSLSKTSGVDYGSFPDKRLELKLYQ
jgi:hypothetical protein